MVFQREVRLEVSADRDFDYLTIDFKIGNAITTRHTFEIKGRFDLIQIERQFAHLPGRVERWLQKLVSGIGCYEPLLLIRCAGHPQAIAAFYRGVDRDGRSRILFHAERQGGMGSHLFLIPETDFQEVKAKIEICSDAMNLRNL